MLMFNVLGVLLAATLSVQGVTPNRKVQFNVLPQGQGVVKRAVPLYLQGEVDSLSQEPEADLESGYQSDNSNGHEYDVDFSYRDADGNTSQASNDADAALDAAMSNTLTECSNTTSSGQSCNVTAFTVCDMREAGFAGCSKANLTGEAVVNIIPGNNTYCLNSSLDYYFQWIPADDDKLLIWFSGGGACWSDNISAIGACASYPGGLDFTQYVDPNPTTSTGGFLNRSHDDMPFDDYTMVVLPYCSGDLFVGDIVRVYTNETTNETIAEARQSGANNTQSTLSWVFENYPNVSRLVISGCSAGSLGAQAWSGYIFDHYNKTMAGNAPKTAVVADGYVGIFPENQRALLQGYSAWNTSWTSVLPLEYRERLENGTLFWCEVVDYLQNNMANSTFAMVQNAYDIVQLGYLNVLAANANKSFAFDATTPGCALVSVPLYNETEMGGRFTVNNTEFFNYSQALFQWYMDSGVNNFVPFVRKAAQHCSLTNVNFYNISVIDATSGKNISLKDWLDDVQEEMSANEVDDYYFQEVCDINLPCNTNTNDSTVVSDILVAENIVVVGEATAADVAAGVMVTAETLPAGTTAAGTVAADTTAAETTAAATAAVNTAAASA